jgi:hypothetical protein
VWRAILLRLLLPSLAPLDVFCVYLTLVLLKKWELKGNTNPRGHLKKWRPPPSQSLYICTTQSSPWRHFGQSSVWLSYDLRGLSRVKSLLLSKGNCSICSSKESGPREPSYTIGGPFLTPFPLPLLDEPPPDIWTRTKQENNLYDGREGRRGPRRRNDKWPELKRRKE